MGYYNQTNEHIQKKDVEPRNGIMSLKNLGQQTHEHPGRGEDSYKAVVESQAELVCSCFPNGTVFFINDSYCRYLKKEQKDLIGKKDPVISLTGDKEYMKEKISSLTPGNPIVSFEHEILFPDGTMHWQECTTRAIFDTSGTIKEYHTVGRDITKRKRIERKFHQIEGTLSVLIDIIGDGAFIVDACQRIFAVNNAMCEKLGKSSQEIVGTCLCDWIDEEDVRLNREIMDKAIKERGPVRFEYARDGLFFENLIYPIVNLTGSISNLAIIIRDITKNKEKEKKLSYLVMNGRNADLPDLKYLEEITKRAIEYAKKGYRSSLLYLNLTNFGYMNSVVGHNKSNEVLITLSGLLKTRLRAEDVIIRVEKDRFALLLVGVPVNDAKYAAHRLQFAVESFHFLLDGRIYRLGNSMGLVEIDGTKDVPTVLLEADKAAKEAQKLGKEGLVVVEGKK